MSIPPLAWLVHELAPVGAGAEVTQLVPSGVGCEGLELTPEQALAIDRADLVVMTGLGLESSIERALRGARRPGRRVVTFPDIEGAEKLLLSASDSHDHADHSHHDDHGGFDPHAWLDPSLMALLAREVHRALDEIIAEVEPDAAALADRRGAMALALGRVESICRAIDEEYRAGVSTFASRGFVTEHNGYAYLARRYGLTVAAVIRPIHEVEPAPAEIEAAARAIRAGAAAVIFVDPQFSRAGADRIARVTGARVLTLDSLGAGDWPALMRANLDTLADGLGSAAR